MLSALTFADGNWQAVFLIFGAMTITWSIGIFFLLPDTPMKARFLSKQDRAKAVLRVKENMTGIKNNKIKWSQVRECLLDVKTWLLVALQLASNIPNGAITTVRYLLIKVSVNVWPMILMSRFSSAA